MKRRDFLATTTLAGVVSVLSESCNTAQTNTNTTAATPAPFTDHFELNEVSISELQQKIKGNQYNAQELVKTYLERIDQIDKKGPAINSIIEVNPDAMDIARKLDEELKAGKSRGPLHGVPVVIKDNIDTADKMKTSAGSLALANSIAPKDSFVAQKLREAGAIIIAKTNLSEWANFRSTKSISGRFDFALSVAKATSRASISSGV